MFSTFTLSIFVPLFNYFFTILPEISETAEKYHVWYIVRQTIEGFDLFCDISLISNFHNPRLNSLCIAKSHFLLHHTLEVRGTQNLPSDWVWQLWYTPAYISFGYELEPQAWYYFCYPKQPLYTRTVIWLYWFSFRNWSIILYAWSCKLFS